MAYPWYLEERLAIQVYNASCEVASGEHEITYECEYGAVSARRA